MKQGDTEKHFTSWLQFLINHVIPNKGLKTQENNKNYIVGWFPLHAPSSTQSS